jgi:hypothetical protein
LSFTDGEKTGSEYQRLIRTLARRDEALGPQPTQRRQALFRAAMVDEHATPEY